MNKIVHNTLRMEGLIHYFDEGFDFNAIDPLPDSYKFASSMPCEISLAFVLSDGGVVVPDDSDIALIEPWTVGRSARAVFEEVRQLSSLWTLHDKLEVYAQGQRMLDNLRRYGYPGKEDWKLAHWGTLSNASQIDVVDENTVTFCTPYCEPENLVRTFSLKHPGKMVCHEAFCKDQKLVYQWLDGQLVSQKGILYI